jgi:dipeptidyl aminopeptidase/acylaminoacyl peptidase
MRLATRVTAGITCALLLIDSAAFPAAAQQPSRPDIVLNTPNTIRIQSLDDPANGKWVAMPGFAELGSPTFSRDGQWIAFDAYKQGFDNSRAECWIARRDGRELKRLAFGATPRFSPDGKRLLFVREGVNDRALREGV